MKTLYRSKKNKIFAGVIGGLGEGIIKGNIKKHGKGEK